MSQAAIEALAAIIGMTSIGIIVLVGLKMRFNHKFRMRERPGGEDTERLTEAVEQLHDEIRLMREEFATSTSVWTSPSGCSRRVGR